MINNESNPYNRSIITCNTTFPDDLSAMNAFLELVLCFGGDNNITENGAATLEELSIFTNGIMVLYAHL